MKMRLNPSLNLKNYLDDLVKIASHLFIVVPSQAEDDVKMTFVESIIFNLNYSITSDSLNGYRQGYWCRPRAFAPGRLK